MGCSFLCFVILNIDARATPFQFIIFIHYEDCGVYAPFENIDPLFLIRRALALISILLTTFATTTTAQILAFGLLEGFASFGKGKPGNGQCTNDVDVANLQPLVQPAGYQ